MHYYKHHFAKIKEANKNQFKVPIYKIFDMCKAFSYMFDCHFAIITVNNKPLT